MLTARQFERVLTNFHHSQIVSEKKIVGKKETLYILKILHSARLEHVFYLQNPEIA
jgi:hypothetical protein